MLQGAERGEQQQQVPQLMPHEALMAQENLQGLHSSSYDMQYASQFIPTVGCWPLYKPSTVQPLHLQEVCVPSFSYEVIDAAGNVVCRSTACK